MKNSVPRKKLGLAKKKHAVQLPSGRLGISAEGGERLTYLRRLRELRLSRTVKPRNPTTVRKRVLFVCPAGMESSLLGMKMFIEAAKRKPVNAILEMDFAGWMQVPRGHFEKQVLGADFVVPMYDSARAEIEKVTNRFTRKPLIIDVDFHDIHGQYNKQKYKQILETIRQRLKKE